jgi:hypothetical protein
MRMDGAIDLFPTTTVNGPTRHGRGHMERRCWIKIQSKVLSTCSPLPQSMAGHTCKTFWQNFLPIAMIRYIVVRIQSCYSQARSDPAGTPGLVTMRPVGPMTGHSSPARGSPSLDVFAKPVAIPLVSFSRRAARVGAPCRKTRPRYVRAP